jgi:hypothetical protein
VHRKLSTGHGQASFHITNRSVAPSSTCGSSGTVAGFGCGDATHVSAPTQPQHLCHHHDRHHHRYCQKQRQPRPPDNLDGCTTQPLPAHRPKHQSWKPHRGATKCRVHWLICHPPGRRPVRGWVLTRLILNLSPAPPCRTIGSCAPPRH